MNKETSFIKAAFIFTMALTMTTAAYAVDACKDQMPQAAGNAHQVSGDKIGSISGTPWSFEQMYQGGNASMAYYDNGTFKANWSGVATYITSVGFKYNQPIDHKTQSYAADYRYGRTGNAQYGYIGVHGWAAEPEAEFFILDDWYSKPNEQYIGEKFGEIEVDGAKYTIHVFLRQQENNYLNQTSTFLQIFSVRESARSCGHIDISAHFKKWDERFTGQTKSLRGSKGGAAAQLKFGNVAELMLYTEVSGNATGSVDYTYVNIEENKLPESSSSEAESSSSTAESSSSEARSSSSTVESSSSKAEPSSSEAASSATEAPSSSSKEKTSALAHIRFTHTSKDLQIFDMQGRYLGMIPVHEDSDIQAAVKAHVQKPGAYLVKQNNTVRKIFVK